MHSVPELYSARAQAYDNATTFHRHLAQQYITYGCPQPGESLLDLACGTGLVIFAFAPHLGLSHATGPHEPRIVGVDISDGMLDVARSKLSLPENQQLSFVKEIKFYAHGITRLDEVPELADAKGTFDIITVCSALVLLSDPGTAITHWAEYLKPGGRLVVDVPHPKSMLSLRLLGYMGKLPGYQGKISVLGDRTWIENRSSLSAMLGHALLVDDVVETAIFGDIPARTDSGGKVEWTIEEGGAVFDDCVVNNMGGLRSLGKDDRSRAREFWCQQWNSFLADEDGIVREEGRLFIGVGRKPLQSLP